MQTAVLIAIFAAIVLASLIAAPRRATVDGALGKLQRVLADEDLEGEESTSHTDASVEADTDPDLELACSLEDIQRIRMREMAADAALRTLSDSFAEEEEEEEENDDEEELAVEEESEGEEDSDGGLDVAILRAWLR